MATPLELYGADLGLLSNLNSDSSWTPGQDLLRRRTPTAAEDLDTWQGVDNLRQALLLRFLTPLGALTDLGHPDYGSRLFELIGKLNDQSNQNLAKLYVLIALGEEPRIAQVESVEVTTNALRRDEIDIRVSVHPIEAPSPLNLVFGFSLASGVGR
jgi:phage baseplate assembly protein W